MNPIEMLYRQTEDAYEWTHKLFNSIPEDQWDETPPSIESNISWQVGHQLMSIYYHSVMVITGHRQDIMEKLPIGEYAGLFTFDATPKNAIGMTNPKELKDHLTIMEGVSLEIITSLSIEDLEHQLEPTKVAHPVAKNKFEALSWNIKHTLWHCGQLAILKRILDERYDFGIKKPE